VLLLDPMPKLCSKPRVAACHLVIHLVMRAGLCVFGQCGKCRNVAYRFTKIGTVHQVADKQIVLVEPDLFKIIPPILLIEPMLLRWRELVVTLYNLLESSLRLRRKTPLTGTIHTAIPEKPILKLMLLQRNVKVVT